LRIHHELNAKPLELTPGHMLFLASGKLPVPAHFVKVGDVLKTAEGPSKVTVIRKIMRKGIANPLTLSGSIVVDGVVSSIHSEESGFKGSSATPLGSHHRLISLVTSSTQSSNDVSLWSACVYFRAKTKRKDTREEGSRILSWPWSCGITSS
jgi:hypothetical protein